MSQALAIAEYAEALRGVADMIEHLTDYALCGCKTCLQHCAKGFMQLAEELQRLAEVAPDTHCLPPGQLQLDLSADRLEIDLVEIADALRRTANAAESSQN